MKTLFIASNPVEATGLNTEAEIVEIQRRFMEAGRGASFMSIPRLPVEDLPKELDSAAADIIHISCHGDVNGLQMSNAAGEDVTVSAEALANFLPARYPPKLIYLNACNSATVAKSLGTTVPTIGCNAPLSNRAARIAAHSFYDLLLTGHSLEQAFSRAKTYVSVLDRGLGDMEIHPTRDPRLGQIPYKPPLLVARFWRNSVKFYGDFQHFELGVLNAPGDTTQIVFFTDDQMSADAATKKFPLEFQLCLVARGTPFRNALWADETWGEWGNIRLFATGITGTGVAFNLETTLCSAIWDYYQARGEEPSRKIVEALEELEKQDGTELRPSAVTNAQGRSKTS